MVITCIDFMKIPVWVVTSCAVQILDQIRTNIVFEYFSTIFGPSDYMILNLINTVV